MGIACEYGTSASVYILIFNITSKTRYSIGYSVYEVYVKEDTLGSSAYISTDKCMGFQFRMNMARHIERSFSCWIPSY